MLFSDYMIIVEGGNAIKSSTRIHQENVADTVEDIYKKLLPLLKLKKDDTSMLGSTGKKKPGGSSGDIDLALSIQSLMKNNDLETTKDIYDYLVKQTHTITHELKDMRQMGLISIAWPIANTDGTQDGEFVQLDLMVVDSIDWATWAYYSPAEWESPWKGLYANEFLFFIAKYAGFKPLKTTVDGKAIEYERYFFDLGKGLLKGIQSYEGKNGLVKNPKTLSKEVVSDDKTLVTKLLFGEDIDPMEIRSYEGIMKVVNDSKRFKFYKNRKEIFKEVASGILKKGYPIPEDLEKLL